MNNKKIFISYSSKDKNIADMVSRYFADITWIDRNELSYGDEFEIEILEAIKNANIAILLISNNFLQSNFIMNNELNWIEKRSKVYDLLRVVPLIVEPCDWKNNKFLSTLHVVLEDEKTFSKLENKEDFLSNFVSKIRKLDERKNLKEDETPFKTYIKNYSLIKKSIGNLLFDDTFDNQDKIMIKSILEDYLSNTLEHIKDPIKTPYDLQEDEFVSNIDTTMVKNKYGKDKELIKKEHKDYIDIMINSLSIDKIPVIVTGNYGMGKSTIARYLFLQILKKGEFPLLLELKNYSISEIFNLNSLIFTNKVLEEIRLSSREAKKYFNDYSELLLKSIVKQKIIVILDGLDETVIKGEHDLDRFIEFIVSNNFSIYLSCREEHLSFTALYNSLIDSKTGLDKWNTHIFTKLKEWKQEQWNVYRDKLIEKKDFENSKDEINSFFIDIQNERYGDLPQRPLFLRMLTELKIKNNWLSSREKEHYSLIESLSSNRSEIYYKYLRWQLYNDIIKHRQLELLDFSEQRYIIDNWIELLSRIAIFEYEMELKKEKKLGITMEEILHIINKMDEKDKKYLSSENIEKILEKTSLFAMLQRVRQDKENTVDNAHKIYAFSHKSFMEYFVAYRLAKPIFSNKPYCSDEWGYYQNHEVSQHFMFEVERLAVSQSINADKTLGELSYKEIVKKCLNLRNEKLSKAYNDTLLFYLNDVRFDKKFYNRLDKDSEKFEEVLFYVGRFKLKNELILNEFKKIFDDMKNYKDGYNPIYYRTVSLALSQIVDSSYCDLYVNILIEDYKTTEKKHYKTNEDTQKEYYGPKEKMLKKLKEYIDEYLAENELKRANISNDILSYFSVQVDDDNFIERKKYIEKVIKKAENLGITTLVNVNKQIQQVFINGIKNEK